MNSKLVIPAILELRRKNGKLLLEDKKKRELLEKLANFDMENDFIEAKDWTILEKTLITYIPKVVQLTTKEIDPRSWTTFCIWGLYSLKLDRFDNDYYMRGGDVQPEIENNVKATIRKNIFELAPLVEQMYEIQRLRLTRNGKPSNPEIRNANKLKEIKGKIDPSFAKELDDICKEFRPNIKESYTTYFQNQKIKAKEFVKNNCEILKTHTKESQSAHQTLAEYVREGVVIISKGEGYEFMTDERIETVSERAAQDEIDSFYFKMADKLGGFVTSIEKQILSVKREQKTKSTAFDNYMMFKFTDGSEFTVHNKIITNWSPLGNPFYQYPCTFIFAKLSTGEVVKNPYEASVKHAFLADNKVR